MSRPFKASVIPTASSPAAMTFAKRVKSSRRKYFAQYELQIQTKAELLNQLFDRLIESLDIPKNDRHFVTDDEDDSPEGDAHAHHIPALVVDVTSLSNHIKAVDREALRQDPEREEVYANGVLTDAWDELGDAVSNVLGGKIFVQEWEEAKESTQARFKMSFGFSKYDSHDELIKTLKAPEIQSMVRQEIQNLCDPRIESFARN